MAKIDNLFQQLIEQNGSDLHLEQGQKPKIRQHGVLLELDSEPILNQNHLSEILQEIVDQTAWNKFQSTGDIDFAYALGSNARFRANYFRHFFGVGAIFRLIPSKILSLEELGSPPCLKNFAELRSGLVLVTGPTGSGKSTTLAAIIDHINSHHNQKIITIEEPVEFVHLNKKSIITHREVGLDTATFTTGLKGAIKSDANIVLVGELRDKETISLALTAAQMGILVFGTLHTNSAAKTIDRIIDIFPTNQKNQIRTSLANTLYGVVAQQLIRSADGSKRFAAHEILLRTSALGSIILSGETSQLVSEMQLNRQNGMMMMDQSLKTLVSAEKITHEEAYKYAIDKSNFLLN